jgi:hypothetical protein
MLQNGVRTRQFNTSWTRITRETSWLKPSKITHFLRMTCRIHLLFSGQNNRNWHCTNSLKHTILLSMFFTIISYSCKWRCTDALTAIAQFVVCLAIEQEALAFNFQLSKFYLITMSRMSQLITLIVISILPILHSSCNSDRLLKSFSLKPLITSGDSLASRMKKRTSSHSTWSSQRRTPNFKKAAAQMFSTPMLLS